MLKKLAAYPKLRRIHYISFVYSLRKEHRQINKNTYAEFSEDMVSLQSLYLAWSAKEEIFQTLLKETGSWYTLKHDSSLTYVAFVTMFWRKGKLKIKSLFLI